MTPRTTKTTKATTTTEAPKAPPLVAFVPLVGPDGAQIDVGEPIPLAWHDAHRQERMSRGEADPGEEAYAMHLLASGGAGTLDALDPEVAQHARDRAERTPVVAPMMTTDAVVAAERIEPA